MLQTNTLIPFLLSTEPTYLELIIPKDNIRQRPHKSFQSADSPPNTRHDRRTHTLQSAHRQPSNQRTDRDIYEHILLPVSWAKVECEDGRGDEAYTS